VDNTVDSGKLILKQADENVQFGQHHAGLESRGSRREVVVDAIGF
jgi:hypothetical protein